MTRAAARVYHRYPRRTLRPFGEGTSGRRAIFSETQIGELFQERASWMFCRPPRSKRIFKQKLHHIVLGKELGHLRKIVAANLFPAQVHFLFLFRLPELVSPAKAIIGGKEDRGQICNESRKFKLSH